MPSYVADGKSWGSTEKKIFAILNEICKILSVPDIEELVITVLFQCKINLHLRNSTS